jgi:hypothetical protein
MKTSPIRRYICPDFRASVDKHVAADAMPALDVDTPTSAYLTLHVTDEQSLTPGEVVL